MERVIELTADERLAGRSIKAVLQRELKLSAGLIGSLKRREGAVELNGRSESVLKRLSSGDTLRLTFFDDGECSVPPHEGGVDIIYEDEDILAVNKPAGLCCHPVSGKVGEDTLAGRLAFHFAALSQRFIPRIITRLDSGTSGLVLLAKNPLSGSLLCSAAARGELKKEYLAVVLGAPPEDSGEINLPLRRCAASSIKREVCAFGEGQSALTHYELLRSSGGLSLLRLSPQSGRTHQLRVHMAALGCPLAGDFLYGCEDASLISRPALHMRSLGLAHPVTGAELELSCALPADMLALPSCEDQC